MSAGTRDPFSPPCIRTAVETFCRSIAAERGVRLFVGVCGELRVILLCVARSVSMRRVNLISLSRAWDDAVMRCQSVNIQHGE